MTYDKAGFVPTIEAIGRVPDKDADNSAGSQDPASQQKGEITRKQNQEDERKSGMNTLTGSRMRYPMCIDKYGMTKKAFRKHCPMCVKVEKDENGKIISIHYPRRLKYSVIGFIRKRLLKEVNNEPISIPPKVAEKQSEEKKTNKFFAYLSAIYAKIHGVIR